MSLIQVNRPYDGSLIKEIDLHDADDVEKALQTAHGLFQDQPHGLTAWQRIEILEKVTEIMSGQIDELTRIAAEEGGKPWQDSRVEVLRFLSRRFL